MKTRKGEDERKEEVGRRKTDGNGRRRQRGVWEGTLINIVVLFCCFTGKAKASKATGAHTDGFWITVCVLSTHLRRQVGGEGKGAGGSLEGESFSSCVEDAVGVAPSRRCSPNRPAARPPACVPGDRFINTRRCRGGSQQQRRLSGAQRPYVTAGSCASQRGLPHPWLGHL